MLLRIAAGMAGVGILAWMVVPVIRRRLAAAPAPRVSAGDASERDFNDDAESVGPVEQLVVPTRLAGGPPQVSLQLRASEPALRRPVMPSGRGGSRANGNGYANGNGTNGNGNGHGHAHENGHAPGVAEAAPAFAAAQAEPAPMMHEFEEGVGEPVPAYAEQTVSAPTFAEPAMASGAAAPMQAFAPAVAEPAFAPEPTSAPQTVFAPEPSFTSESTFSAEPCTDLSRKHSPLPRLSTSRLLQSSRSWRRQGASNSSLRGRRRSRSPAMPEPAGVAEQPATGEAESFAAAVEPEFAAEPIAAAAEPTAGEMAATAESESLGETIAPAADAVPMAEATSMSTELQPVTAAEEGVAFDEPEPITASTEPTQEEDEPIGQGQPVPYLSAAPAAEASTPAVEPRREQSKLTAAIGAAFAGIGALRKSSVDTPASASKIASPEPSAQQSTTPAIMAQPTQPTPAPVIRGAQPAASGGAPQAAGGMPPQQPQQPAPAMQPMAPQTGAGGMHTAVQLTFSCEIASLQLTPNFKMGSLQLRPTSKVVTMRLAPSQQPQPAMNLQVTFEIASVQGAGNAIGVVRLTPSQQQRPTMITSPSFNITGLQLVSGSEQAPVQLTPSTQGQASVLVTASFQIATVEFSPTFEIASIVLNATSRSVNVQLPGTGPSAVEGAPVFDISNVQLSGAGEIGMMQLAPRGAGAPAGGAAPRA
jgi:hypothetical protein